MSTSTSTFQAGASLQRVLIAIDGSVASDRAVAYAQHIVPPNASVHIVSIAENPRTLVPLGSQATAFLEAARNELLKDASDSVSRAKNAMQRDDIDIDTEVIDLSKHGGDIVRALVESTEVLQAELLIVGAHQHHGLRRWIEGTVSGPLARLVRCPLLIVPESFVSAAGHLPQRILFAVDGSPLALHALRVGLQFSRPDTELRAIYVQDRAVSLGDFVPVEAIEGALINEGNQALQEATTVLDGVAAHSQSRLLQTDRTGSDVSQVIVHEAIEWNADMIVMGTHGRRGIAGWVVGSVAGRVARITKTPVLLVNARRE
ncbi:universal stress protein [Burkholderia sp. JP2-270]|uniref:universal stress protein n=1 Tax=Burkholderia sp. JP2-270 TaxID=2217913 RepID=UPI000DA39277|nr:universal stress protein [Burkholderia sp. JP2-270]AWV02934.1 universal stress protein [Burkholderia sp. JP2-270]